MKINNNLNNEKVNLKQKAQAISNSVIKYDVFNDREKLEQIENAILNVANNGETELTFYLRKMPQGFRGIHGFTVNEIVIDLDDYPTTTFNQVIYDLTRWFVSKGFDEKDIVYTLPKYPAGNNEPLISSVTVNWKEKKGTNVNE